MKTKTLMVALATLLIGSLCFWACQKELPLKDELDLKTSQVSLSQVGPDDYIIVFKSEATDVPGLARQLAARHNGEISFVYQHAIKGFAATLPPQAIEALSRHPLIDWIEPDQLYYPVNSQTNATWGLDRIDQRALPLDQTYNYNQTGQGVTVYIIDTGIHYSHVDFGGRAVFGFDASRNGDGSDTDGHGTHVAGTVGSSTYGVAKNVTLVSVRVLGTGGSAARNIIAGVDWVTANRVLPAVANMSLGGAASNALDAAVRGSIESGVTYVLSAGNMNDDACKYSPARVREALTLGATRNTDERWDKSNYGECVDLFAPGVSITSTFNTSNTATAVYSGTSMAAPHAAGVAALYLELNPEASPAQVFSAVTEATTKDIVTQSPPGNNHLLYSLAWEGGDPPPPPPNQPPVADFSFTTSELTVTFTDESHDPDGEVVGWAWNFGDEGTSSTQNPIHIYASGGTYTVTLTVTDNDGATDTASQDVTVISGDDQPPPPPNEPPVADFSFTTSDLTVTFTDQSYDTDGSVVAWNWSFGDGTTSSAQHPVHTYAAAGTYTVTLTVTDNDGATDTASQDVTVAEGNGGDPDEPVLSIDLFDLTNTSNPQFARVLVNWEVSGKDLSVVLLEITGPNDDSRTWSVSGNSASGHHEFSFRRGHGNYNVTLTVTDASGNLTETKEIVL